MGCFHTLSPKPNSPIFFCCPNFIIIQSLDKIKSFQWILLTAKLLSQNKIFSLIVVFIHFAQNRTHHFFCPNLLLSYLETKSGLSGWHYLLQSKFPKITLIRTLLWIDETQIQVSPKDCLNSNLYGNLDPLLIMKQEPWYNDDATTNYGWIDW